jgi:hypothetical protein
MRTFEPEMLEEIDIFLRNLKHASKKGLVVNMSPACKRLSLDIIGRLAFGYKLQSQTDPTHRVIVGGLKRRGDLTALYFF